MAHQNQSFPGTSDSAPSTDPLPQRAQLTTTLDEKLLSLFTLVNAETGHDITERKKAEDELRRQAEELRVSNEELTFFTRASIGRELHMIALKKEVNELCGQVRQPSRYPLDFEKERP